MPRSWDSNPGLSDTKAALFNLTWALVTLVRLKDDFFPLNYGVALCSSVGEWGEGNKSRAFCTLSHLECSQTRCPEVADSFEMAAAGTGFEVEDRLQMVSPPSLFYGSCERVRKKPAAVCLDGFNFGSCVQGKC